MSNSFYNASGTPGNKSSLSSSAMRAELAAIAAGFDKMPVLSALVAGFLIAVNAAGDGLESVNAINGITVGVTTPAAGKFTSLTSTGNTALGDAAGDTLTIAPNAVTWSGNPTHSGNHVFSGNLSVGGNTALGDAASDTLSVSGSAIKNSTGNWTLPAPTAGTALTINALAGNYALSVAGDFSGQFAASITSTGGATNGRVAIEFIRTGGTAKTWRIGNDPDGGSANSFSILDATRGANTLQITSVGGVLVNTPSSGNTVALSQFAGANFLTSTNGTTSSAFRVEVQGLVFGTTTAHGMELYTNNATRIDLNELGNIVINAPSSGNTLTLSQVGGGQSSIFAESSLSGGITQIVLSNSSNTANSDARHFVSVAGSSAGDPYTLYGIAGFVNWSVGADNSDNDRFKISASGALGTSDRLMIDAAGNVTVNAPSAGDTLTLGQVAGANGIILTSVLSGSTAIIRSTNGSNTAASDAQFFAEVAGSSGGDPHFRMTVSGVQNWAMGIDNSDSDALVVAASNVLGTTNRLRIPTSGAISLLAGAYTPTSSQAFTATPTFDASLSNVFEFSGVMTGNVTSTTITNPTAGQTITIRLKQDGTGGRTVAAPAGSKIAGSVSTVLGTASLLTLTYSAMDTRWEGAWTQLPA